MKKIMIALIVFGVMATKAFSATYWLTSNKGHIIGPFQTYLECSQYSIKMPFKSGVRWHCEIGI